MKNFLIIFFCILAFLSNSIAFCENLYKRPPFRRGSSAATDILSVYSAESGYKVVNSKYATLDELTTGEPAFLPQDFADGEKDGYIFQVTVDNRYNTFYITAEPQDLMEKHSFYIDERGILCKSYKVDTPAPLRHAKAVCPPHFKETSLQKELLSKD